MLLDNGAVYRHDLTVTPEMIDENQHVNNVEYVKWTLDAAMAHSTERGWPPERYWQEGMSWVIRSHHLDYWQAAKVGDALTILSWTSLFRKVRFERQYKILRGDEKLVTGYSQWVFVDHVTQRPKSIPPELIAAFPVHSE